MTINAKTRKQVRQRANFRCEFCGVTEIDAGGQLTIDHLQPWSKGGKNNLENLIYCCARCNRYKGDYWPDQSDDPTLWNPRQESASQHFLELEDGTLHPLTSTGIFTINYLRLNRPALVAFRLRKQRQAEEARLLTRYQELIELFEQLNKQMSALMEEQQQLLEEQRELLRLMLRKS